MIPLFWEMISVGLLVFDSIRRTRSWCFTISRGRSVAAAWSSTSSPRLTSTSGTLRSCLVIHLSLNSSLHLFLFFAFLDLMIVSSSGYRLFCFSNWLVYFVFVWCRIYIMCVCLLFVRFLGNCYLQSIDTLWFEFGLGWTVEVNVFYLFVCFVVLFDVFNWCAPCFRWDWNPVWLYSNPCLLVLGLLNI